ncbi:MAG: 50S ribosomal protein L18 [Candidatus Vogelbacteria bacterium CG10_big_fil_rev_8_21_14_0_10_45_14]|uniref:Large ribosomal subunit protein uL18 n=1 Tax=Candidatus Vogelbacteria bacterium CG10_big_fil_rev_8_21_14_0_10_45_14 TaxID=1975042 RepID=A0A2H0RJT3_9BACT|nr:MAG: 50S ribosomal protein L18 [Candidatus Vogelbacteria bacterium CG10_big_fil_rev_8_21_14_0_10_45_14]
MISKTKQKNIKRERRHRRIRAKVKGTSERPRLTVYRSNKFIYAQIIDDESGKTLLSSSDFAMRTPGTKAVKAEAVGMAIAKGAKEKGISKIVFDRSGFIYTGRVSRLAEAARKGGLEF